MWNIVEECGCFVWQYGCNVDVTWNILEECGCFVELCGCNVEPPHLHSSHFHQVLSSPRSLILKYANVDPSHFKNENVDVLWRNVDVMWNNVDLIWTLHISTFHNFTISPGPLSS